MNALYLVRAFQYSSCTVVFVALILSRITYALPAWGGQLTRQLQERLDAFLKRARKSGFCEENYATPELLDKAGFLGLYRDQNIVFIIFYLTLLTAVQWS